MNWKQITLHQWKQLEEISNKEYEDDILKTADIISVVFGIDDPMELTPSKFNAFVSDLGFLTESIPETKLCNTYTINGTKYNFKGNVYEINTAQFFDYRKYSTKDKLDYAECLSVFMIPDGHTYNDGYDMDKTIQDIETLPITDVMKLYKFFRSALYLSLHLTQNYLLKMLKQTKISKQKIQEIKKKMEELEEISGTFFLTSSPM